MGLHCTALQRSSVLQGQRRGRQWGPMAFHQTKRFEGQPTYRTSPTVAVEISGRDVCSTHDVRSIEARRRRLSVERLNLAGSGPDIGGELRREGVVTCYEDLRVYQSL